MSEKPNFEMYVWVKRPVADFKPHWNWDTASVREIELLKQHHWLKHFGPDKTNYYWVCQKCKSEMSCGTSLMYYSKSIDCSTVAMELACE